MHRSPHSHLFSPPGEEERTRKGTPSPDLGSPPAEQSQVDLRGNDADAWSHCLSFKKDNGSPEAAPASVPSYLLPPASFTLFGVVQWVFFCFPVSTVTLKGTEHRKLQGYVYVQRLDQVV